MLCIQERYRSDRKVKNKLKAKKYIFLYEVIININTRLASASFIKSIEQTDTFEK